MKTIEIKQKLVEEALDQLKSAQQDVYVQSTQNVIDELELALRQPSVISRRELLLDFAEYSENDKTSTAIDECVDNYLDSIKQ